MEENDDLINKVANSGLLTINLEHFYPPYDIASFDIKDYLFQGLILKEKDFRQALKDHEWTSYRGQVLTIFCSTDAIVPVWAFMLVASYAKGVAAEIYAGSPSQYLSHYYHQYITRIDPTIYQDKRIVIKGCSDLDVPASAYADILFQLQGYAQSIMYGEPCSTVPIYKRPRKLEE